MKTIDANTGIELHEGLVFENVNGRITVHQIVPGWFKAKALLSVNGRPPQWQPLKVRWTHPNAFGQHIAFLESHGGIFPRAQALREAPGGGLVVSRDGEEVERYWRGA